MNNFAASSSRSASGQVDAIRLPSAANETSPRIISRRCRASRSSTAKPVPRTPTISPWDHTGTVTIWTMRPCSILSPDQVSPFSGTRISSSDDRSSPNEVARVATLSDLPRLSVMATRSQSLCIRISRVSSATRIRSSARIGSLISSVAETPARALTNQPTSMDSVNPKLSVPSTPSPSEMGTVATWNSRPSNSQAPEYGRPSRALDTVAVALRSTSEADNTSSRVRTRPPESVARNISLPMTLWNLRASLSTVLRYRSALGEGISSVATKRGSSATTSHWLRSHFARSDITASNTDWVRRRSSLSCRWTFPATYRLTTTSDRAMSAATMPTVKASILYRSDVRLGLFISRMGRCSSQNWKSTETVSDWPATICRCCSPVSGCHAVIACTPAGRSSNRKAPVLSGTV